MYMNIYIYTCIDIEMLKVVLLFLVSEIKEFVYVLYNAFLLLCFLLGEVKFYNNRAFLCAEENIIKS